MGYDPEALFWRAHRAWCRLRGRRESIWAAWFGNDAPPFSQFGRIFGLLPLDLGDDGFWAPRDPTGCKAREYRPVIAVRTGDPFDWSQLGARADLHPGSNLPPHLMRALQLNARAQHGLDFIDLLAVDGNLTKPPLRLTGMAAALGGAMDTVSWSDVSDQRVLVVKNLRRWLEVAHQGPCLPLGSEEEQAAFLRGLAGGVQVESVEHGKALKRLMARPAPTLPEIYLPDPNEAAA